MSRTIDMTPTWAAAIKIYLYVLENPNAPPEARASARYEILRLARAFDQMNADPAANDEESENV